MGRTSPSRIVGRDARLPNECEIHEADEIPVQIVAQRDGRAEAHGVDRQRVRERFVALVRRERLPGSLSGEEFVLDVDVVGADETDPRHRRETAETAGGHSENGSNAVRESASIIGLWSRVGGNGYPQVSKAVINPLRCDVTRDEEQMSGLDASVVAVEPGRRARLVAEREQSALAGDLRRAAGGPGSIEFDLVV